MPTATPTQIQGLKATTTTWSGLATGDDGTAISTEGKNLSVQVHPNNEYAQKFENDNGKTEMWYVVDCKEDASIFCGFTHGFCESDYSDEEIRKKYINKSVAHFFKRGSANPIIYVNC